MADLQLIIDYKNGNIKVVTDQAEKEFEKSGEKSGKKFSKSFDTGSKDILPSLKRIGAAAAAIGGITFVKAVKDAASLEVISTQFEVILGSAGAAQKQLAELQDFAASTPFQLPGLSEATKQLLSFGVEQENIIGTLQQLGDIAAGAGADITELTIPFGRLVSTQKLTLQELDKFADRGVNIYAELAKQTGGSLKTIRDDISKGTVPFEAFTQSLNNLTGETGIFFQGMQKQSKTLTGVISTLGDNFFNLSASIGKAFSPIVVDIVNKLTGAIQSLTKDFKENFNVFDDVAAPLVRFNEAFITYVIAPFELLKNVGDVVFDSVTLGINSLLEAISVAGVNIAEFLNKFGLESDEEVAQWKDRADILASSSEKLAGDLTESLNNVNNFSLSEGLRVKNEELRTYFQEQRAIIEEEGNVTQEGLKTQVDKATETSQTFADLTLDTFDAVKIGVNKTKEEMSKVATQTANIVKGGLAKGISGGIQNIVTSLAKGENVFENFGKFLLQTVGDLAIQLGSFFIAEGIAVEALNAISGTGAIAAGAALVALGSLLKAAAGGGGGGNVPNTTGGTAPAPRFEDRELDTETLDETRTSAGPATVVNFNVDGNIKGDEEFIRGVVEDIGSEAGKQGLVFDNFATT